MKEQSSSRSIVLGVGFGIAVGLLAAWIMISNLSPGSLGLPSQLTPAPTSISSSPIPVTNVATGSSSPILPPTRITSPSFTPTADSNEGVTYVVLEGDTLLSIADKFDVTVGALRAINAIEGYLIYPEQELIIPTSRDLSAIPTPTPAPILDSETTIHIVQSGDTLSSLAELYGMSVDDLQSANELASPDNIWIGQRLIIPYNSPEKRVWQPSILIGNLETAYPGIVETERFTLHYTPETYPARDPEMVAVLVMEGLTHIEDLLEASLEGHFDVYVAGSIFASPNQALRGRSFSAARRYFFLHDGTGNMADQRYIATHELTHLFTWNVFGQPVSAMLSEGVAVYTGMMLIADSDHMPIDVFCTAYHKAGKLPRVSTTLSFRGHIRDLENYYASGCFVQYLVETYGSQKFGQLYPTGNYSGVYGKRLVELEAEWISHLEYEGLALSFDVVELLQAVEIVKAHYNNLFGQFTGSSAEMSAYLRTDMARLALLEGKFEDISEYLPE